MTSLSCYLISMLALLIASFACQILTCHGASAGPDQDIPEAFDYPAYLAKYQKAYGLVEAAARAKLFLTRTLDIFKANLLYASHKNGHYLHQNEFIDQTPDEIKSMLLNANNDLLPVKEALLAPDTPADHFIAASKVSETEIDDQMTKSSLSDLSAPPDVEASRPKSDISFFGDTEGPSNLEPSKLINELRTHSNLAKEMSNLIKISPKSNLNYQNDLERKSRRVAFKPIVDATNKEFDPSLVETRGFSDSSKPSYNGFYANIMMDDFLGFIDPYPAPPKEKNQQENNDPVRDILSGFMNSLKTFHEEIFKQDKDKSKLNQERVDTPKDLNELETDSKKTGIEYTIDWRKSGCLSRLKNQSKCNACYAFATLDLIEYFYCREMGVSTEFSAQYVIDCGTKAGLNGCQGGKLSSVKTFINNYGLQANSLYPYTARDQTCPYDESDQSKASLVKPLIKRWAMFSEIQAWYKWIAKSPIIVGINMPTDFLAYGGGIHSGLDCTPGMVHALLLVGAGKEDGKPFWLLKNTFSEDWGEGGYFRLSRKAPIKCFNSAVVARVTFKETS